MTTCQSVTSSERVRGYAAFVRLYFNTIGFRGRHRIRVKERKSNRLCACDAIGRQCYGRIGYASYAMVYWGVYLLVYFQLLCIRLKKMN